jgi:dipeptidyl aminopeptidase/acylaminoacyl peptidase
VATATPSPTPSPSSPPQELQATCEALPTAKEPLALLSVSRGATDAILASVADPLHPRRLCSIAGGYGARFVNGTTIAYVRYQDSSTRSNGSIVKLDLVTGKSTNAASWTPAGFGLGPFAFSPDGKLLAYLASLPPSSTFTGAGGVELHLVSNSTDRVLTTLPGIPGRGVSPDNDDLMLSFSPDGNYFAMVETYTASGSRDQSGFQVRRSDGTLVATVPPGTSMGSSSVILAAAPQPVPGASTMAVWSGSGAHLYFRDDAGVNRLDPGSNSSLMVPGVKWVHPFASADGRWITYMVRDDKWLPHAGLYDVTKGTGARLISQSARDNPVFLTATRVWYEEVRLCVEADACGMGGPTITTGNKFLYDLTAGQETPSSIGWVNDVWPRSTP